MENKKKSIDSNANFLRRFADKPMQKAFNNSVTRLIDQGFGYGDPVDSIEHGEAGVAELLRLLSEVTMVGSALVAGYGAVSGQLPVVTPAAITCAISVVARIAVNLDRFSNSGGVSFGLVSIVEVLVRVGLLPVRLLAKLGLVIKDGCSKAMKEVLTEIKTELEKKKSSIQNKKTEVKSLENDVKVV